MCKTHKHLHKQHNRNTFKTQSTDIHGKLVAEKQGWTIIHIHGNAFQRGYAHGHLLKLQICKSIEILAFFIKNELKISRTKYMQIVKNKITTVVKRDFPEFYEEIVGISNGAKQSIDNIMGWNAYLTIYSYLLDGAKPKCSAFIATGNATDNGQITMAHNTHTNFADGQLCNIMIYVQPTSGFSFVMQTQPGLIASGTDWFQSSSGIIGCETTIADIKYKPKIQIPYFCRIRQCMQYAKVLDEYVEIMTKENGGDYPCSWLLGDINTNEIMLFELGQHKKHVKRTKNGFFYGMNSVIGKEMRKAETNDKDIDDLHTSSGNRNARFKQLLGDEFKGKITVENAKEIISDHYDVVQNKQVMNGHGICRHSETDDCDRNSMYGTTDAKVVDTNMAKSLSFIARFGSACGRKFSVDEHINKHTEYKKWHNVIDDFPFYSWTEINA